MKQPKPGDQRRSKRLKRLSKAGRKLVSRLSASVRDHLERVIYRFGGHQEARFDRAAAKLDHLHRPDFIIIGAPKCGTSWLQRALAQHPNIVMVPDEIEYFSMHFDYSVEWYLNHFVRGLKSAASASATSRMIGEKSARYCSIAPDRIGLMHRLLPDARLILMTRDPVARHWSQAKRFFSKRRLHKQEGGILAMPREEVFAFFDRMRSLGEFSAMIARWTDVYSPEQLLIVSQEKALAGPREAYDAVLTHIGVSRDYDPKAIKLLDAETNLGPKLEMPKDVGDYLESMFAAERERLDKLLGDRTAVYISH